MPGEASDRVTGSVGELKYDWKAGGVPVEFVSLTGALGVQLRATVSSFGPLLLAKALSLNETQTSVLTLVFKYADDSGLPLLDLSDLRAVLPVPGLRRGESGAGAWRHVQGDGGRAAAEAGGAGGPGRGQFFGEPEFDVHDMLRTTSDGRGVVTCLELADAQDKPALFSTFMMWLLAELYHNLPEAGDLPKPKLVFFFDEAHLLFDEASGPSSIRSSVVRLIRSRASACTW